MHWANFLHIYQPYGQQPDILEAVVAQSYRPLIKGALSHPKTKLTLNVTGALLELFDKYGYQDLIDGLRQAAKEGKIEFTGSAKYHALLPFLDEEEIINQIKINDETNRFYLGDSYSPKGFFPPEMAYSPKLAPIVESLGFKWIIIDEIAYDGHTGNVDYTKLYNIKDTNLKVFFRERRISNLIMSAVVRSTVSLKEAIKEDLIQNRYAVTGMDGETFGHHRPGLENLLFEIFEDNEFNLVTVSELLGHYSEAVDVEPIVSTWASSPADIESETQFISWKEKSNQIHDLQWKLFNLVHTAVSKLDKKDPGYKQIRHDMDIACASDHYFWASTKPWWGLEMIEEGAYRLFEIAKNIPEITLQAESLYNQIIATAFSWQRTNMVRRHAQEQKSILRIPFRDRTEGVGGEMAVEFKAFLDLMKLQEEKAVKNREYEAALMWRDAVYKLTNKLDIYDAIHAVDLLRIHLGNDLVEKTLNQYKEEYRKMRGGQPEQRDI
jgi:hypothetical protein